MDALHKMAEKDRREFTISEHEKWEDWEREVRRLDGAIARGEAAIQREGEAAARRFHGKDAAGIEAGSVLLRPDQSLRSAMLERGLMIPRDDLEGVTAGHLARALITGPRSEGEKRALAEGADASGGISVPATVAADFFDTLRPRSVIFRAGARVFNMTTDTHVVARTTKDPVMVYRAEAGPVANDEPTFAGVTLVAKSHDVYFKASREVLEDSININEAINASLIGAAAVGIDTAALAGSSPGVIGIINHPDVDDVAGAGTIDWDDILNGFYILWKNNVEANAIVVSPRERLAIAKFKGSVEGNPLIVPPAIAAVPLYSTTVLPYAGTTVSVVGDFTKMIVGVRAALRIAVARELFAESGEVGFFANMRIDMQLAYPQAFATITGITS
jgi:HK97 family phage major capsid protein